MSIGDVNNHTGTIATLAKIANACEKNGKNVKDMINILRRPDKKVVLEELNNFQGKTETQRMLEEQKRMEERKSDFGIGEY